MDSSANTVYDESMFYWSEVTEIDGQRHEKQLGRSNDRDTALDIARHLHKKKGIELVVIDDNSHNTIAEFVS